jgi:hypothetical protein
MPYSIAEAYRFVTLAQPTRLWKTEVVGNCQLGSLLAKTRD